MVTDHRVAELEAELAALRAELDLYRDAEKDLKGATIAKQFRDEAVSRRAELETLRASANVEIARLAAELETAKKERDDLRKREALLDGHCNSHIAERDALNAELETARAVIAEQKGRIDAGRAAHNAEKVRSDALGRALETARAALETNGAEQSRLYSLGHERGRAVAIEEAARVAADERTYPTYHRRNHTGAFAAEAIRALSPLDPALRIVPACYICGSSDAVLTERVGICSRGHRLSQLDPALMIVEKADYDALVSYPCAVAFDAARAGWSVEAATGVDFNLDESRKSLDLRAQEVAVQAAIRLCQRAAKRCRDAADGSTYSAEWIERAKGHESDAAEIAKLAPLDPALEARDEQTLRCLRSGGAVIDEAKFQRYIEYLQRMQASYRAQLKEARAKLPPGRDPSSPDEALVVAVLGDVIRYAAELMPPKKETPPTSR